MFIVYYREGYQVKSAKEKSTWRKPSASLQVFLPRGVAEMRLISPPMMCDTCKVLLVRGAHRGLGIQGVYWGVSVTQACTACVADPSCSGSYGDAQAVFLLYDFSTGNCTDRFFNVKSTFHSWDKARLLESYCCLHILLDLIC